MTITIKLNKSPPLNSKWYFQGLGGRSMGIAANSNLPFFCYEELEKLALYKFISQSEAVFIVYSEPIASRHVNIKF